MAATEFVLIAWGRRPSRLGASRRAPQGDGLEDDLVA